eukprot:8904348-Alexandrium_andersonii.AAC.1
MACHGLIRQVLQHVCGRRNVPNQDSNGAAELQRPTGDCGRKASQQRSARSNANLHHARHPCS